MTRNNVDDSKLNDFVFLDILMPGVLRSRSVDCKAHVKTKGLVHLLQTQQYSRQ